MMDYLPSISKEEELAYYNRLIKYNTSPLSAMFGAKNEEYADIAIAREELERITEAETKRNRQ